MLQFFAESKLDHRLQFSENIHLLLFDDLALGSTSFYKTGVQSHSNGMDILIFFACLSYSFSVTRHQL